MTDIIIIFGRTLLGIVMLIVLTRIMGLRSFSKMSGFDFAITVAMGSVLASMATTPDSSVWTGPAALVSLFVIQQVIARIRANSEGAADMLGNDPLLIMKDGKPLMDNLHGADMTLGDLHGKLREANAYDLTKVKAVVFEPTGDVSVLHGDDDLSAEVMEGVRHWSPKSTRAPD